MSFTLDEQRAFITTDAPDEARRKCTDIWVTKDLRGIEPKDMEDTHLLSAIGMLVKNASYNNEVATLKALRYANNAPDGAADAANAEASKLMDASRDDIVRAAGVKYPVIHTMARVVIDRGLDWVPVVDESIAKGLSKFLAAVANAQEKKTKEREMGAVLAVTADAYKPTHTFIMPSLEEALKADPHEMQVGN